MPKMRGADGRVVKAEDSRPRGLGFDSRRQPSVKALGKLWNPHRLGPPSRNGYLVERLNENCQIGNLSCYVRMHSSQEDETVSV